MFKLAASQACLFSELLVETLFYLRQLCRGACVDLPCADIALWGKNYFCIYVCVHTELKRLLFVFESLQ